VIGLKGKAINLKRRKPHCHGVGGILDNRVITLDDGTLDPRCLTLASASVNSSHINRKRETTVSD
jgi:hypothetical protein